MSKPTLDEVRALLEKATPGEWEASYLRQFCPSTHHDLGDGLHAVTGEIKCLSTGGQCDGHDNQNWSRLRGPEKYRQSPDGEDLFYSRDATLLASAKNVARLAIEQGEEIERLREALTNIDLAVPSSDTYDTLAIEAIKLKVRTIARAALSTKEGE